MRAPFGWSGLFVCLCMFASPTFGQDGAEVRIAISTDRVVRVSMEMPGAWAEDLRLMAHGAGEWHPHGAAVSIGDASLTTAEGGALPVTRVGINLKGAASASRVTLTYSVSLPRRRGGGGVHWGADFAALIDPARFLYAAPAAAADAPITVIWDLAAGWPVATALAAAPGDDSGRRFLAKGFAELLAARTVVGQFESLTLDEVVPPHRVVYIPNAATDPPVLDALRADLVQLFQAGIKARGTAPPHGPLLIASARLNQTIPGARTSIVRAPAESSRIELQRLFISMATAHTAAWTLADRPAHEIDSEGIPERADLWWREGLTAYLGALAAHRAALMSQDELFERLGQLLATHRNHPERPWISPAEASRRWPARPDDEDAYLSPRLAGRALGFALDAQLRGGDAKGGLDAWVGRTLAAPAGTTEEALADGHWIHHLKTSFPDAEAFLNRHVTGTEELPWPALAEPVGLRVNWLATHVEDPRLPLVQSGEFMVIGSLAGRMELANTGLKAGDKLLGLSRKAVRSIADYHRVLTSIKPGQRLRIDVQRGSRKKSVRLMMRAPIPFEFPLRDEGNAVFFEALPEGPIKAAGIEVGDQLERVGRRRIGGTADVREELARSGKQRGIMLGIVRNGRRSQVPLKIAHTPRFRAHIAVDTASNPAQSERRADLLGQESGEPKAPR